MTAGTEGTDIEATMTVIADEDHVLEARHFVGEQLAEWGQWGVADAAVLLTSEVVSNAVVHAGPHPAGAGLTVLVRSESSTVRVEVADGSTDQPRRHETVLGGLSGRGLLLLDALASAWGSTPNRGGKTVWFEIDVVEPPDTMGRDHRQVVR